MNNVFRQQLREYVLVFFDDILVYSPSEELHLVHLQEVLTILLKHQFFAYRSKCSFAQTQIDYLGYVITQNGVGMDP